MNSLQVVLCLRFGAGAIPMSPQNIADALVGNLVTQIGHCSDDATVTPARVLARQFHHPALRLPDPLAGGRLIGVSSSRRISERRTCDTRRGAYPVWRCRRLPVGLSAPDAWQSQPR